APVPTDAGAAGLAAAGAAELDRTARQDYYALRDDLALTRRMVLALQDYARSCSRSFSTQPQGSTQ
ncbi:lysis system i-spanin subunit Rz, partial [Pseudomonas aeruginosa]